jgi:hypothetical protein
MAAGLGFKTFTTGEVLTAGDTNGYLMQGILVFASAAARDAAITSPQEGQACYLKDTNEVLTYSGSAWVAVGGSSGAVVQVKSFTTSTTTTITSATFASTALTLSITPTSASNKILVFGQLPSFFYQNVGTSGNYNGVGLRIVRGATNIFTSEPGEAFNYDNFDEAASGNMFIGAPVAYSYLDSPATTSATTYTLQGCVQAPSATALFNYHNTGTITLMEVTP